MACTGGCMGILCDLRKEERSMTRREMISSVGVLAGASAQAASSASEAAPPDFGIGVATCSLREFQRGVAIKMIKQLGITHVSVKDFHLPYTSTPAEIAKAVRSEERRAVEE